MKIDFLSDIHLDFWVKELNPQSPKFKKQMETLINIIYNKALVKGDVLVIAGDIGHSNQQTMYFLIEMKKFYKEIIVTFGNHDMYLLSNSMVSKYKAKSENRLKELKEICEGLDIHFLDGNIVNIDGIKFGGTGSWYNLPTSQDIQSWKKVMNDSRRIYNGYAMQSYGMYQSYSQPSTNWDTQKFWENEKTKLIDIAEKGCDVFVTHVGLNEPTVEEGMNPKYENDPYNIFYYTSNIELLKKSGCKLHIHGHTHQPLDYKKDGVRIICQALGYPSENSYASIKQIEI